ncbi:DUF3617 domain-containing protein [Neptunomonas japonica]|uniref:DUF3617 domain-containing protein n=1 Tax=Neptunomonas japonica TaxID=417574 RepID=UPI0004021E00|nr:DUF3617 family protein [Neptunomonas japonica]
MKTLLSCAFMLSALALSINQTHAATVDSVPFNAGKWEITSRASMPMLAKPLVNKNVECIREKTISADHFTQKTRGNCKATDVRVNGKNIQWNMSCNLEGNLVTGRGNMQVNDTKVKGKAIIAMSMQGMKLEMTTTWSGKRLGECN